ncbi:MAG: ATP-binding cassette domain-containing protein [Sphingomonadales bacterium]|nr:ATP-binding cassette domain-containing protein [Sphingomonadales bacterium]
MELAPLKPSWLLTVLTLSAVLILGKHGIGESLDTPTRPNLSNNGPIKVVATTGFLADIAARIAGQSAQVQSLLPQGSDPHRYDAVPNDTRILSEADLIIENGLHLEGWLDKLIARTANRARRAVATKGIVPIQDPKHANSYDPHAWMDPELGRHYARNIYEALLALCPNDSIGLSTRWAEYDKILTELNQEIFRLLEPIPHKHRILGTNHDAFRYFAARYQFRVISLLGTSTDADIRTSDVLQMKRVILENDLPCIFVEANLNPKMLQEISADAGCALGPALYADSMGPAGSEADSYIGMLRYNAAILARFLGTKGARAPDEGPKESSSSSNPMSVLWILFLMLPPLVYMLIILRSYSSNPQQKTRVLSSNPEPRLVINDLSVTYDRKSVLNAFSVDFESGKCYGILGPNGAGKSTLFKAILGLAEPDHGNISYRGQKTNLHRRALAYVPQKGLVDWDFPATVEDIIQMGRLPWRRPGLPQREEDRKAVQQALDDLELTNLRKRPLNQLSGGQQQRVFLARALAQQAETLLLDEPFVGVDAATEAKIIEILRKFTREKNGLVLMIHHDLHRAAQYFDKVLLINQRLIANGAPEAVLIESNLLKVFSGVDPGYADAAQFRNRP